MERGEIIEDVLWHLTGLAQAVLDGAMVLAMVAFLVLDARAPDPVPAEACGLSVDLPKTCRMDLGS